MPPPFIRATDIHIHYFFFTSIKRGAAIAFQDIKDGWYVLLLHIRYYTPYIIIAMSWYYLQRYTLRDTARFITTLHDIDIIQQQSDFLSWAEAKEMRFASPPPHDKMILFSFFLLRDTLLLYIIAARFTMPLFPEIHAYDIYRLREDKEHMRAFHYCRHMLTTPLFFSYEIYRR